MIRAIASSAFHALFGYCTTAFRGGVVIVKQAITVKCIWNPLRKLGAVKVPVSGKGTGGCKIFAPFGKIIHCPIWMEQTESWVCRVFRLPGSCASFVHAVMNAATASKAGRRNHIVFIVSDFWGFNFPINQNCLLLYPDGVLEFMNLIKNS